MKIVRLAVAALLAVAASPALDSVPALAAPPGPSAAPSAPAVTSIPVLLYHGIDTGTAGADEDTAVSLANFTAQMTRLKDLGYHTISPDQYVAWLHGEARNLPRNPVLLTFDDNQASSTAAAPVVRAAGFRPTMYVVSGFAEGGYGSFYLPWDSVRQLAADGWYAQVHAGPCGHAYLTASTPYGCANGLTITGDAQTGHRYYPLPDGQSDALYRARVKADIAFGIGELRSSLGYPDTWRSATFAVPWDDWGQPDTSNQPWLSEYLAETFDVVFVQESYPGAPLASARHMRYRYQVGRSTTLDQFTRVLTDPRFAATAG